MYYPLTILKESLILNDLKFKKFVSDLDIIGYEIDSSIFHPVFTFEKNVKNCRSITIELKIPTNRSELENEIMLTKELSNIFSLQKEEKWNSLKDRYNDIFLIKYKNSQYFDFINELFNNFSFYIYLENELFIANKKIPSWIIKKLLFYGVQSNNFFEDIFALINIEYGNIFSLKELDEKQGLLKFSLNLEDLILEKSFIHQIRFAFSRLISLIEVCSAKKIKNFKFESLSSYSQNIVDFQDNKIVYLEKQNFCQILGINDWDLTIFEKIGVPIIFKTHDKIVFSIPIFRKDLERPIDLIEEYCRFLGYDFFKKNFSILENQIKQQSFSRKEIIKTTKNYFLYNGFQEILTSPILKESSSMSLISLKNPLNKDFSHLRSSILDSLLPLYLKGKVKNSFSLENRFFEIGRIFKSKKNQSFHILEEEHIGGIIEVSIKKRKENLEKDIFQKYWLFFKAILENYFQIIQPELIICEKLNFVENYYHPQNTIVFYFRNDKIATFGEIHPLLKKELGIKSLFFLFEINLSILKDSFNFSKVPNFLEFSKYPQVIRDISFLISKNIDFSTIPKKLSEEIPFLQSCSYIDIFPNKEKTSLINLSLRCQFQKKTETLTTEEIDASVKIICRILEKEFYAKIN